MTSSKTFECITECNSDCTFEKHFQKVIFINQGVTIWCSNDAFSLAKSESRHALGQFWAWGQFRFVRTEPSSNSILKSISGRLRVNSIRTWIENIDTEQFTQVTNRNWPHVQNWPNVWLSVSANQNASLLHQIVNPLNPSVWTLLTQFFLE